ncbi:MAG: DUF1553 domain-containing protein, partial [bacterium]
LVRQTLHAMITLDAPSREYCNIRRIQTNTPLQTLVTLNDSVYVEAAQALARRAIRESAAPDIRSKISSAVAMALLRPPTTEEVDSLVRLYNEQLAWYSQKPAEAEKMATLPLGPLPQGLNAAELAAMTNVTNVILNLDEFLTKP